MRVLKWMIVSSLMGVLAACASGQAVTPPPMPTDAPTSEPVVPSATPLIAATAPVDQAATAQPPTDSAPALKSTFIFLWEPG